MTPDRIEALVHGGESETLEFKRTTAECESAARAVCAMLNHRGGRVLFGVTPGGQVIGQDIGDTTIERVAQSLRAIEPPAFPSIDRVMIGDGREVIAVVVSSGRNRPYTHKHRAWRRVGSTNEAMTQSAYESLLVERLHAEQRWENQPAPGWAIDDLDHREIHRTVEEAIRRGRLEDPGDGGAGCAGESASSGNRGGRRMCDSTIPTATVRPASKGAARRHETSASHPGSARRGIGRLGVAGDRDAARRADDDPASPA